MPPYRRTRRPQRRYRRRRPASRGQIYGRAAGQLWKDVQKLKNFVNVEFKQVTTPLLSTVHSNAQIQLLNGLAQGDDDFNREGDQVRFKSLQSEIQLTRGTQDAVVRLAWVIDTKPNQSTAPTYTDIYSLPDVSNPTVALRNLNNRTRFVILKEKLIYLNDGDIDIKNVKLYRKLDMKTMFTSSSGGVTNIQNNALYFVYSSNVVTGATAVTITATNRLRYIDN